MPQRVAAVLFIKTARGRIVTKLTPMTPALAVVLFRTSPLLRNALDVPCVRVAHFT